MKTNNPVVRIDSLMLKEEYDCSCIWHFTFEIILFFDIQNRRIWFKQIVNLKYLNDPCVFYTFNSLMPSEIVLKDIDCGDHWFWNPSFISLNMVIVDSP